MRIYGKKIAIYILTAALVSSTLIPSTALAANKSTAAPAVLSSDETEVDMPFDDGASADTSEPDTDNTFGETISYEEQTLTVTDAGFVSDTFNGVDAVYRPGTGDGSNATYSCAAFVKKYYKAIYGVSVYNLFGGKSPSTYEGKKFGSVSDPRSGDIAYSNGHWSIIKAVKDKKVILIEQNWKWQQGGKTVCKANRTVNINSLTYYRLK